MTNPDRRVLMSVLTIIVALVTIGWAFWHPGVDAVTVFAGGWLLGAGFWGFR